MKTSKLLITSFLYIGLLLIINLVHVNYINIKVVLYSAILDGCLATAISGFILFRLKKFDLFNNFEKILILFIWLLISYALAISVPTIIDRSLSFYILEKIQQRGGGINHSQLEEVFVKEYINEHRLVDVRVKEKLESGTIIIEKGCVKLTSRGDKLATLSRNFRKHFLPKQRLLLGKYSDDLIDPFKNSIKTIDYECK
jgi:hypothetical protein